MHYPIGDWYEQNVDEIWNSEAAQKARESIADGSFSYCRKVSCPFLERDSLPDVTEEEMKALAVPAEVPEFLLLANDKTCNIACTTCRSGVFCPSKEERDKIDHALQRLKPYADRTKYIDVDGSGEFLASPGFMRFLEELRPERSDCTINMQTNGVLFDEAHWNKLSHLWQCNLEVNLTLNSLHRGTYRYLSGGFDYLERVIDNIKFLSELRREEKIKKLTVTMVVQECNFQEIPEYVHTLDSEEYTIDELMLRPVYKWFGMSEETYWFKNILNPLHPYHKQYLKVLEDDCWNNPKIYDWGCHNLREARPHPMTQEKIYNQILLNIYENPQGLSPVEYVKGCVTEKNLSRVGIFGENEFSNAMVRLLQKAGVEIVFQLTWFQDENGTIPKVSMQNFRPKLADVMLLLDFYDQENITNNLRSLKFQGSILTAKELFQGSVQ